MDFDALLGQASSAIQLAKPSFGPALYGQVLRLFFKGYTNDPNGQTGLMVKMEEDHCNIAIIYFRWSDVLWKISAGAGAAAFRHTRFFNMHLPGLSWDSNDINLIGYVGEDIMDEFMEALEEDVEKIESLEAALVGFHRGFCKFQCLPFLVDWFSEKDAVALLPYLLDIDRYMNGSCCYPMIYRLEGCSYDQQRDRLTQYAEEGGLAQW